MGFDLKIFDQNTFEKIFNILLHKIFKMSKSTTFQKLALCARGQILRTRSCQKATLWREITISGHTGCRCLKDDVPLRDALDERFSAGSGKIVRDQMREVRR